MMGSLVPAFVGMLTLALLPSKGLIWTRWAMYMMTVFGQLPGLRKHWREPFVSTPINIILSYLDISSFQRSRPHKEVRDCDAPVHRILCW